MGAVGATSAGLDGRFVIEWGAAHRPKTGEAESGDQYIVKDLTESMLVAVVDGLGHGAEAAAAARLAISTVEANVDGAIVPLLRHCHDVLHATRGAVMGLATFDDGENGLQWLGVGNVEGVVLHAQATARPRVERLLARGGIVGYRLPPLSVSMIPLTDGDVVVLATDGIRASFLDGLETGEPPRAMADRILAEYGMESDDALVLVVRYHEVML